MRRCLMLTIVAITVFEVSTATAEKPKQPGPAPYYTYASATEGDYVVITRTFVSMVQEQRTRIVKKNGIEEKVPYIVCISKIRRSKLKKKIADLEVTNAAGEKKTAEDIRDALEKPQAVLLSSDGQKVDPFYLKTVKPDTLVIVFKNK